jgi:hypothetical protein
LYFFKDKRWESFHLRGQVEMDRIFLLMLQKRTFTTWNIGHRLEWLLSPEIDRLNGHFTAADADAMIF